MADSNYIEIYDANNTVVSGTGADDSIWAGGSSQYVTVYAGAGKDTVWGGQYFYIDGGSDNDYLYAMSNSTLIGGTGDDSLDLFYSGNSYAFGGDGNDSLVTGGNQYENTTLDGGAGDDYISNCNIRTSISGGAGNDSISNSPNSSALTIYGGTGNDTVTLANGSSNVVQYNSGDGNDVIIGFNYYGDTLQIGSSSYSTTTATGTDDSLDVIISVGDGSITLKDVVAEEYLSYFTLNIDGAQITGDNILQKENNAYTYSGGSKIITSYASGEKLNWSTDLTGINIFNSDNFVFSSSSGDLTIQNVCDKVVDFSYNGTTIAYLAKASGALDLDASGLSQFLILAGGDSAQNNFTAGSGGSWLWGGAGSYGSGSWDTLIGGSGSDVFFFGKNDGSDFIKNASSSDVVNLYDISVSDITSLQAEGNTITLVFNTGADLQIQSSENVSAKITMSEGSVNFNHSTGQWNLA